MPKKEKTSIKETITKNLTWLLGLSVALVNLWLANKLVPLETGILRNANRVSAVEVWVDKHDQYSIRVEGKIDSLIENVAILKGQCSK